MSELDRLRDLRAHVLRMEASRDKRMTVPCDDWEAIVASARKAMTPRTLDPSAATCPVCDGSGDVGRWPKYHRCAECDGTGVKP